MVSPICCENGTKDIQVADVLQENIWSIQYGTKDIQGVDMFQENIWWIRCGTRRLRLLRHVVAPARGRASSFSVALDT